jgi:hypothetical protein
VYTKAIVRRPGRNFANGITTSNLGKLLDLGYNIIELEMSEFRKMDGSLTCLSFRASDAKFARNLCFSKTFNRITSDD